MSRPEGRIEEYLRQEVKKRGGIAVKFTSPGSRAWPDRLVLMPDGRGRFIEMKAPGKKPTAQQKLRHRQLASLGWRVAVLDSREAVDNWIKETFDDGQTEPLHQSTGI